MITVKSAQGLITSMRATLKKHGYQVATAGGKWANKIALTSSYKYGVDGKVYVNQLGADGACVKSIDRELLTVLHKYNPKTEYFNGRIYIVVPYELSL